MHRSPASSKVLRVESIIIHRTNQPDIQFISRLTSGQSFKAIQKAKAHIHKIAVEFSLISALQDDLQQDDALSRPSCTSITVTRSTNISYTFTGNQVLLGCQAVTGCEYRPYMYHLASDIMNGLSGEKKRALACSLTTILKCQFNHHLVQSKQSTHCEKRTVCPTAVQS